MDWLSNQASYAYNQASYAYKCYDEYMHPSYSITSLGETELPTGLKESGMFEANDHDQYLIHDRHSKNIKDDGLTKTCNEIVEKGIRFASINMDKGSRFGNTTRGNIENYNNFSRIIVNMLTNSSCQLQYLDVSDSSLEVQELIEILDTSAQSLKCIYIGSNDWSKEDITKLYEFLLNNKNDDKVNNNSKILILGLHNLLIPDQGKGISWKELAETPSYQEITKTLDDYNLAISPGLNLDAQLKNERIRINDTGQRILRGTTYH